MSHNTFGHLFRVTTFGESHGAGIGCVVDGCPPMIPLDVADIQADLDRRRPGSSRFTTQRREPDEARILSGVMFDERNGRQVTTGTPIAIYIENVDQRSKDYGDIKDKYRPGHADWVYEAKYGIRDYRGGGRSSARETATRVAAGAVARKVIPGVTIRGALVRMGKLAISRERWDWDEVARNPFFTPDAEAAPRFAHYLDGMRKHGSSVGAVIELVAEGVPVGWGRGRRARRHRDRTAGGRALCGQADLLDPDSAQDGHAGRRGRGDQHQGPSRPLRRDSRGAGRRGDDGLRARRRVSASSRAGRRPRLKPQKCVLTPSVSRFVPDVACCGPVGI